MMADLHEWLATGGQAPPWDYIKGEMCRMYGCVPSVLAEEDVGECWRQYVLVTAADAERERKRFGSK